MKKLAIGTAILLLSGCFGGSDNSSGSTYGKTKQTAQTCPESMTCSFLSVPKDYANPDKGTVKVHYGIQHAKVKSERIGILVFNFGGPGAEAVVQAGYTANNLLPKEITDRFDIVGIDPRGSGQSAFAKELTECSNSAKADCSKEYREFAQFLGSNTLIKDIDALRAHLNEDKINFIGYSYGTRVGSLYAEKYPQRIRALVLDSPMPPDSENNADLILDSARGKDTVAGYRLRKDERKQALETIVAKVRNAGSYYDSRGNEVKQDDLIELLARLGGSSSEKWVEIEDQTIEFLDRNDATSLLRMLSSSQSVNKSAGYNTGDRDEKREDALNTGVICTDESRVLTEQELAAEKDKMPTASKLYGDMYASHINTCLNWPGTRDPINKVEDMENKLVGQKILIIGGQYDYATPYFWSEKMHKAFGAASSLIKINNLVSHGFSYSGADFKCLDDKTTNYLLKPDTYYGEVTCEKLSTINIQSKAPGDKQEQPVPVRIIRGPFDSILNTH